MPSELELRNQFVACRPLTAATRLRLSFSADVWRMRTELTDFDQYTTDDSHTDQNHRRGRDQSRETPNTHAAQLQETGITNLNGLQVW